MRRALHVALVCAYGHLCACVLTPGRLVAQEGSVLGTVAVPAAGITAIVVYLVPEGASRMRSTAPVNAQIDQRNLKFVPRAVAVTPGSEVAFPNSDPVMHNVFHPSLGSAGFDLGTYPQGERRSFTFADEGAYVIFCNVHPEMVAYVVVVASPYRAVTDESGRFRIDGVAPGTYRLRTWHRRLRTEDRLVSVTAGGVVRMTLDLGYGFPVEPRTGRRAAQR